MAKGIKDGIYCAECNIKMHKGSIPRYEYEPGYLLHNVQAYLCQKCNKTFFTEDQIHEIKTRNEELKEYAFGFERKVIISGKSLVIGIPSELAVHLNIKQGQKMRIIPIAKEGFMIKKYKENKA